MSVQTIDDLVVLGRAAPEPVDDGRHTVCLGGYSPSEGYVRLYPTQKRMTELKRWNVVSVPVESAAPDDTRDESYKIAGSKEDWDSLHNKIQKVGRLDKSEQIQLVDRLAVDCRNKLNEAHDSLGMVNPETIINYELEPRDDQTHQVTLDGTRQEGKTEYKHKLYIEYQCTDCVAKTSHRQHCIEWGIYLYWKKNDDYEGVFDALKLTRDDYKHYFFIGNLTHRPSAYIIISDIRFSEQDMLEAGVAPEGQSGLSDFS